MSLNPTDLQNSYGDYYLAVNPDYTYVPYQQEKIVPALERVEKGENKRLMIFMHPGAAKSDLVTRYFACWYMGRNPKKNLMICSYAATLATDAFGSDVKRAMKGPVHRAVFPDCRIDPHSDAKTQFKLETGGTFYSVGFGGGVLGKRVDCMILDDLIKNDEEADSEPIQDKLFNTYSSVIKSRLRPGGVVILCQHRWRPRDIAGRILEAEGLKSEGGDWEVLKLPAEDPPGSGNFLWESHFGKQHYTQAKRFEESWESMWQQDPAASKSLWFREEWLEFYDIKPPVNKFNNYMICDPAISKERKSDRTSLHMWGAGQDGKRILLDWVLDRLDPGERAKIVLSWAERYKPVQVIYEELGLTSDSYFISKMMREQDMPTRWYPTSVGRKGPRHLMSKAHRIKELKPIFFDHKIVLPRKFMYTMSDGRKVDLTERFIKDEYLLYKGEGSVQHEDDLDCMSRMQEPELVWRFYEPVEPDDNKIYARGKFQSRTWESLY